MSARRILRCPGCGRRHDVSSVPAGRGFGCDRCDAVLIVLADPRAKGLALADAEQAARVRRRSRAQHASSSGGLASIALGPRIQLCPCGRKHDTTSLAAGRGFPCDKCERVLVVPTDPTARELTEADPTQADRVRRRLVAHTRRQKRRTSPGSSDEAALAPDDSGFATGAVLVEPDATPTDDSGEDESDVSSAVAAVDVGPAPDDDASFVEDAAPVAGDDDPGDATPAVDDSVGVEVAPGPLETLTLGGGSGPADITPSKPRRATPPARPFERAAGTPPAAGTRVRSTDRPTPHRAAARAAKSSAPARRARVVPIVGAIAAGVLVSQVFGFLYDAIFRGAPVVEDFNDARLFDIEKPRTPAAPGTAAAPPSSPATLVAGRAIQVIGLVSGDAPSGRSALALSPRGHAPFWVEDLANTNRSLFAEIAQARRGGKAVCVRVVGVTRDLAGLPDAGALAPELRARGVWIEVRAVDVTRVAFADYLATHDPLHVGE